MKQIHKPGPFNNPQQYKLTKDIICLFKHYRLYRSVDPDTLHINYKQQLIHGNTLWFYFAQHPITHTTTGCFIQYHIYNQIKAIIPGYHDPDTFYKSYKQAILNFTNTPIQIFFFD